MWKLGGKKGEIQLGSRILQTVVNNQTDLFLIQELLTCLNQMSSLRKCVLMQAKNNAYF